MSAWRRPLLPLALALALGGCNYDELTRSGPDRPSPVACGGCHVEVYREWAASTHARAFDGARYAELSADHDFEGCVTCHAPDSIFVTGAVRARDVERGHGVDCVACHLHDGQLVGPLSPGGLVDPHPVRRDEPLYRTSALCGRCHEGTYAQWTAAPGTEPDGRAKRTCQECHMPAVERTTTQATSVVSSVIVALEDDVPQRRHEFGLEAVRSFGAVADLALDADDGELVVTVRNRLPHALPTGDFGPRRIEAHVTLRGSDGAPLGSAQLAWSAREGTAIEPYGRDARRIALPAGCVAADVTLRRPSSTTHAGFELARATWRRP